MNYLAHAWLSFNEPEILVGNMISDFVKGRKRFEFDERIQKGIMLHRNIDEFTDTHEATKRAKTFFKKAVGLYAGAFVDVVYDHFLANDKNEFSNESLLNFSLKVYITLTQYQVILPERFAFMLPYMQADNWLFNYRNLRGAEKSFEGLLRRAKYLSGSETAFNCFTENYTELQQCYEVFFPAVKAFAYQRLLD